MSEGTLKVKNNADYDVTGIGSALLDLTVEVESEVIDELGLPRCGMQLIEADRSREIRDIISSYPMEVTPGGSAANTVAGVITLGGTGLFMGKVGADTDGDTYISETEKTGVVSGITRHDSATGHAITFITPDHERTFATHLGAALHFRDDDIDREAIMRSRILHIEGYLFESPELRRACMSAIKTAGENNTLVSVDLSDPGLIGRIHDTFVEVVRDHADIVFVNEEEALAFTGKSGEDALEILSGQCEFAAVKLGPAGSLISTGGRVYRIMAAETEVVNTNGAGDMYAAGALYSISRGLGPEQAGTIASYAASRVVSRVGARVSGRIDTQKVSQDLSLS